MVLLERPWEVWTAFAATWFSNVVCVYLICQHIRHYTQPGFQRYICRIIFIVPFYCTGSWLALKYRDWSIYFETPRDCYEAWVIYNFMSLCMAYVGGPGAVVVKSDGKLIEPSWMLCTCCWKAIPVDGFFLRNCKQGTLQFVIAKPFLAFFTLGLFAADKYQVGNWSYSDGYAYVAFIYNLCYSLALFWMLLFYVGTHDLLAPYKPLLKFFVFKTVIFLTFWQGLLVTFMATRFGWSPDDSEALQNWLICVEMFFAAIGMFFAFPHQEYQLGGAANPGWSLKAFYHAVSIMDVLEDIIIQFNPGYKAYVLHTDGGPSENVKRKKFRGKKKATAAFSFIKQEVGAVTEKMKRLKTTDKRRLVGGGDDALGLGDEQGGHWHSAVRKQNIITDLQGGMQVINGTAQQVVKWIPGISEMDRRQAELLDSDSDAEYDEENQRDNQLDDTVLTSDSDDGNPSHRHGRHANGHGGKHGRRAPGQLASGSSSDGEPGTATETDVPSQHRAGGRLRNMMTSDSEAAGYGRNRHHGAGRGSAFTPTAASGISDWAQFPDANSAASPTAMLPVSSSASMVVDDSWAQFPAISAATPAPPPAAQAQQKGGSEGADVRVVESGPAGLGAGGGSQGAGWAAFPAGPPSTDDTRHLNGHAAHAVGIPSGTAPALHTEQAALSEASASSVQVDEVEGEVQEGGLSMAAANGPQAGDNPPSPRRGEREADTSQGHR